MNWICIVSSACSRSRNPRIIRAQPRKTGARTPRGLTPDSLSERAERSLPGRRPSRGSRTCSSPCTWGLNRVQELREERKCKDPTGKPGLWGTLSVGPHPSVPGHPPNRYPIGNGDSPPTADHETNLLNASCNSSGGWRILSFSPRFVSPFPIGCGHSHQMISRRGSHRWV